eukprot:GHUV01011574.1.p1 GENE.GHUV01011574.1~~GHUV01011574.1.p1  ORF type:complete len:172 (-),score=18.39 GHUV01011574.1:592-1107(-)
MPNMIYAAMMHDGDSPATRPGSISMLVGNKAVAQHGRPACLYQTTHCSSANSTGLLSSMVRVPNTLQRPLNPQTVDPSPLWCRKPGVQPSQNNILHTNKLPRNCSVLLTLALAPSYYTTAASALLYHRHTPSRECHTTVVLTLLPRSMQIVATLPYAVAYIFHACCAADAA